MPGPVIITATDANLFWLAKGLVASLADMRAERGIAMACFDLGLTPSQRDWLAAADVRLLDPVDPLGIAGREGFRPYMLGQFCRPFLPGVLPGHDIYVWLDADTWQQRPDGLGGLLHVAGFGLLACCPEMHVTYSNAGLVAPRHLRAWHRAWTGVFGREVANSYAAVPMINSGIFAAPGDHPLWSLWQQELRIAIERPLTHLSEQMAFCRAVLGAPRVERLPAHWNWLCGFALPRWSPRHDAWIEPAYPHQPLRFIHLVSTTPRARYLREGMLYRRGAYLEPGDLPEALATAPRATVPA